MSTNKVQVNIFELAFNAVKIASVLMPAIIELVKQFEVPGIEGASKKDAVMGVLKGIIDGLDQTGIQVPGTVILTIASFVIDAVVAAFNLIGIFKK